MVAETSPESTRVTGAEPRASRTYTIVNWVMAVLTAAGAVAVVAVAYGLVLGTAGCSDRICPRIGSADAVFSAVVYGAPVVSLLAIAASLITASRPRGWIVPTIAWVLLTAGGVLLAVFVRA